MNRQIGIFAGGCFWCMVKPFDEWPGILSVRVGYTGGSVINPTYEQVCEGNTGHVEAVRIEFDEEKISYQEILTIYFHSIDPTDEGGQFADRGPMYQTVIFYTTQEQKEDAIRIIHEEQKRYKDPICVQLRKAEEFYEAEEYHQEYYKKNKVHYRLYYKGSGRKNYIEENHYKPPFSKEELKKRLPPLVYHVTQENGTEAPFTNEYDQQFEEGIYVDAVSGKPLFSSKDKFESGCGWPTFSKPIANHVLYEKEDRSHGMLRVEVRSTSADSHLGHVFEEGPLESGGARYCINSAALRFIPKKDMVREGYGAYLDR